ncbi:MAG: AbgT family transporter [Acidobacteria bacterium]|uniref:AbgT family transporter n=1 Tax=Candidatus Polarisedimenticola svalbardensis TaxID=2886004 RepID=A0A8J6Y9P6_9BACT|nr:AbgT family transporter [Candidatus Polarisedimenticola svalbardensis]
MSAKKPGKSMMLRMIDLVEHWGNKLPHPFWLFCFLIIAVSLLSAGLQISGVSVTKPETQILKTDHGGQRIDGMSFAVGEPFEPFTIDLEAASHSSRLANLFVEIHRDGRKLFDEPMERDQLKAFEVSADRFPVLTPGEGYVIRFVSRSQTVTPRSLLSREGLNWFVLSMVKNFAHFEPLGLVLVMLMGVAVAEGAGLIPTVMRSIALSVPTMLIIPVLFALAACGNIGSDAGIVVIPPLAAAIFRQLGKSPIAGLLVGYVGATAGFTANILPAGTDVLAMSLTNAATGGNPEVNVFSNWYFMVVSVVFLALVGTFVTRRYVLPRFEVTGKQEAVQIENITPRERKAMLWALAAVVGAVGVWLITIIPENGLLRNPDPNPALVWRSNFFKGLVPILFTLFVVGGVVYGKLAGTIKRADDVVGYMADSMKRMGGYIVLILVISQFTEMFQFARLDEMIAVSGANLLRAVGMEQFPIPFFVAFIIIIAVANLFMGSASAKWAIFAPIFVPMFMTLGYHPAFTQLLYRLGDSITNCVSPLYPFFPVLLGWIAEIDKSKAKVGTVLSYLVPYANFLFWGWILMLIIWYLIGLPVGPDSPIHLAG